MLRKLPSKDDKIIYFRGWFFTFSPPQGNYFWTLLPLHFYLHEILFTKALINKPGLSVLNLVWIKKNMAAFPEFYLILVCPDVTNTASLMDHPAVSHRPCCR